MVQLQIVSGKTAGSLHAARRFPFIIGRGSGCNLRIEEDGVWDRHATLSLSANEGFVVDAAESALVSVNGEPAAQRALRNGDEIVLGSARIRFWLSDPPQRALTLREALVWGIVVLVTLGQAAAIYWLW